MTASSANSTASASLLSSTGFASLPCVGAHSDVVRCACSLDKRQKRSRKRADEDEGDITWINEKNRQFNRKLQRYYDDVTRETRENFERGALLREISRGDRELTLAAPLLARRNGALSGNRRCACSVQSVSL